MLVWEVCGWISLQYFEKLNIYKANLHWNKISKHIISQCGIDFQFIPLHIIYNSQHFEPIQYVNGLFKSLSTF